MAQILKLQTLHSLSVTNTDDAMMSSFSGLCPTVNLNGLHAGHFDLR